VLLPLQQVSKKSGFIENLLGCMQIKIILHTAAYTVYAAVCGNILPHTKNVCKNSGFKEDARGF
jgi:hypothetical protein